MKLKLPFTINYRPIGLYVFATFIAYLGGIYFVPHLFILFISLLLYPIISGIILIYTYTQIRFSQNFSNEHPVKGEMLDYIVHFTNETRIPFNSVHIHFMAITPTMDVMLPPVSTFIKPGDEYKEIFPINCPFRGIYNVGLEEVRLDDLLHFISINLKVWHQTFYVYPRILNLQYFTSGLENVEGGERGQPFGGEPDYAMFDQLKEYRDGESVKHIYWKKLAILGKPVLKNFETSPQPAVRIYFDLNKPFGQDKNELEIEDTSVEILVSVVKYFMDRGIHTMIKAPGREFYNFYGSNSNQFKEFYESTVNLIFQNTISLARMYKIEETNHNLDSNSVFFITHSIDPELLNLMLSSLGTTVHFTLILNQCGFSSAQREENKQFIRFFRKQGANIITVDHGKSIVSDLERPFHG